MLNNVRLFFVVMVLLFMGSLCRAQSVSFALKTSPSINFNFNTVQKYVSGITVMNVCELNIEAVGAQWDLHVGASTTVPGLWDVNSVYAIGGAIPSINIMQLQFRNASNTSQVPTFFPIQDILTPTYIIGTALAPDAAINCPATGTNQAGDYMVSPGCYKFNVDMKVIPGLGLQSGSYSMRIDYILVQDL